jgi:UDP:flavonoid glycosyltransferase YjiC (YdhE family)
MLATEACVLSNINGALRANNKPLIKQVSDLYHSQDQLLLTSYPEFDHYTGRQLGTSHYTGITSSSGRKKPCWPKSNGKRIFAYLKPSDALPELLRTLQQSQQSLIIYSNNINPKGLVSFQSPTMHFEYEPLDLSAIAEEADFAIVNGGHNTSAELLIRAIPLIVLSLQREQ